MISATYEPHSYTEDGSTTLRLVNFPFIADSHLVVTRDGTVLELGVDYTVTGGGPVDGGGYATGSITMTDAGTDGELVIKRSTPVTQAGDYGDDWPTETLEQSLDKLTMIAQEQAYEHVDSADLAEVVADILVEGDGITLDHDADAGTITITNSYDAEFIRDTIGTALTEGSGITITVNDSANTITITADATVDATLNDDALLLETSLGGSGSATAELVRDIIATALVEGAGISIAYDDTANTITITNTANAGLTSEEVLDAIHASIVEGTGISVTVSDVGDTVTIALAASVTATHQIWIPAGSMIPRTTNGADAGAHEMATNDVMLDTLDFDQTTGEAAQWSLKMPKSWDHATGFTARVSWSSDTTGPVTWGLRALARGDGDDLDAVWGTEAEVTDSNASINTERVSDATAEFDPGGTPAQGDRVIFEIYRDPADAGDTLAADARLHGVQLTFTTNARDDS